MPSNECYWIYKLTSPSGYSYVGLTRNIVKRFNHYYHKNCKQQRLLYAELLKYNFQQFKIEILKTHLTKQEAIVEEQIQISKLQEYSLNLSGGYSLPYLEKSNRDCVVVQYSVNGEYIATYSSCADASCIIFDGSVSSTNNIAQASRERRSRYYKGYLWYRISDCVEKQNVPPYKRKTKGWSVVQLTLGGSIVEVHANQNIAAKKAGVSQGTLNTCLKGKRKTLGGFKWAYEHRFNNLGLQRYSPIVQYDADRNIIAEYNTVTEASATTGVSRSHISRYAQGRVKKPNPYIWEYKPRP